MLSNGNYKEDLLARLPIPGPGRKKMTAEQKIAKKEKRDIIINYLKNQGIGAASRIVKLSKHAKAENIVLSANQDILDRIGVGVGKGGTTVAVQVNISNILDDLENDRS